MKKIRILHTADLHLDTSFFTTEEKGDLLRYELLEAFCKIADIARQYKIDAMVICGDITDNGMLSEASYNTVKKTLEQLEIPVFLILGNHDLGFKYDLPKNVYTFDKVQKYSIDNVDIYGSDFEHGFETVPVDESKINIMLAHGTVNGSDDNPIPVSEIEKSGLDYLALGHIHRFEGLKKAGNTFYAYSGVPVGRGFDEQGRKGVLIADIEKNNVSVEFVPVAKREYKEISVDISDCFDYIEILEKIKDLKRDNLYKIKLRGSPVTYIDLHSLKSVLDNEFFYVRLIDETAVKVDIMSLSREESLTGYFVKNVISNGGDDETVKYGLSALKGERIYIDED